MIIGFSSLASLLYGGYLALIGQITLGRFVAFNQYVNMLVWPMLACSEAAVMFSQGTASIRRVQEILEAQTNVKDTASVTTLDTLHGDIRFNHLTFAHLGNTSPVLHDINLDIPSHHRAHRQRKIHSGQSSASALQHQARHDLSG